MKNQKSKLKMNREIIKLLSDIYLINWTMAGVSEKVIDSLRRVFESLIPEGYSDQLFKSSEDIRRLFKLASKQANSGISEIDIWELLEINQYNSFLDVGSNNLRTIKEIEFKFKNFEKIIAVDLESDPKNKINYSDKLQFFSLDFSNHDQILSLKMKFDVINFKFSLHHFESNEAIQNAFNNALELLNDNGKLIIWEESFNKDILDLETLILNTESLGIEVDHELTKSFYGLNREDRMRLVELNDLFINARNPHMQWVDNYKAWEEWKELASNSGFMLENEYNLL
ncbi:MAG: class I SAM-dependent methyltransferase, partial [Candidatus Dojkabacteria bacterium]|nr:class I SAM-dependent methyltransferase [Candidatus Dojkabacteria bacterium]